MEFKFGDVFSLSNFVLYKSPYAQLYISNCTVQNDFKVGISKLISNKTPYIKFYFKLQKLF